MNMTATVSRLDSFRYWRGNEAATVEDWLNEFNAPPNHRMDVGAAFNAVLESLAVGGEVANCTADGITFNFKCDAAIPQMHPVYGRKEYGPVLVSGRAGIVEGKRVEVFKTTKKFEAERRLDDFQWRLLLDLFDADEFVWNIFVIAPNNPDETSYDVLDYHRLTAHRYPGLHDDCVSLINDYHGIMSSIPEEDMFMASTGRGKAKANAVPKETVWITIHADILQQTEPTEEHDGAILVNCGEVKKLWIPLSVVKFSGEVGDTGVEVDVQEWFAEQEGLHEGQGKRETEAPDGMTVETFTTSEGEKLTAFCEDFLPEENAPSAPQPCRFKGDVTSLGDDSIALTVTSPKGKEKAFIFNKTDLRFEGDDVADLQVGYKGIDFVIGWDVAVASGLAKHLKLKAPKPAPDAAQPEQQAAAAPAAPEAAPEVAEDEAPQAKPYKSKLRTETVRATVELTPEEKNECAKRITDALSRRTDLKEKASWYSSKAREAEKEAYKASEVFESGEEERDITCDVIGDFNTRELVYVESEWPHREIQRRPMTDKDRQLLLPIDPPAQPRPEPEAATPSEPETAEASTEPAEPETVTLYGALLDEMENSIKFLVCYGDEAGTEAEFEIPHEQIVRLEAKVPEAEQDEITLTLAYAVEAGIVAAPEPEKDCSTCKHGHDGEEQLCMRDSGIECTDFSAWEQAEEAEPEKTCANCTHMDAADETNACESCGDDLVNFMPFDAPVQQESEAVEEAVQ